MAGAGNHLQAEKHPQKPRFQICISKKSHLITTTDFCGCKGVKFGKVLVGMNNSWKHCNMWCCLQLDNSSRNFTYQTINVLNEGDQLLTLTLGSLHLFSVWPVGQILLSAPQRPVNLEIQSICLIQLIHWIRCRRWCSACRHRISLHVHTW